MTPNPVALVRLGRGRVHAARPRLFGGTWDTVCGRVLEQPAYLAPPARAAQAANDIGADLCGRCRSAMGWS